MGLTPVQIRQAGHGLGQGHQHQFRTQRGVEADIVVLHLQAQNLAPQAGVSESPFRRLCRRFGADVVVSEFVSAEGLRRGSEKMFKGMPPVLEFAKRTEEHLKGMVTPGTLFSARSTRPTQDAQVMPSTSSSCTCAGPA